MLTLVTGASGHIGANLVRSLLAQGRPVRALVHRNVRPLEGLDIEIVYGDICDPETLHRAFHGADVVYHLAARVSILKHDQALLESVNVIGTRNVVEACLACGVRRLVHFSSVHALTQEPLDTPLDETRPYVESGDCPPYSLSKANAEKEVCRGLEKGLDAIILNPTAVVGPHDYQPSLFGEALIALANRKLPALVSSGFDWVDVRDVVWGAARAEERAPKGSHYLLSGHWVSLREVATLVSEITGTPTPSLVLPVWLVRTFVPMLTHLDRLRGQRPLYTDNAMRTLQSNCNVSHEKAAGELDYNPRPFRETIHDTLRWFEASQQLELPKPERSPSNQKQTDVT